VILQWALKTPPTPGPKEFNPPPPHRTRFFFFHFGPSFFFWELFFFFFFFPHGDNLAPKKRLAFVGFPGGRGCPGFWVFFFFVLGGPVWHRVLFPKSFFFLCGWFIFLQVLGFSYFQLHPWLWGVPPPPHWVGVCLFGQVVLFSLLGFFFCGPPPPGLGKIGGIGLGCFGKPLTFPWVCGRGVFFFFFLVVFLLTFSCGLWLFQKGVFFFFFFPQGVVFLGGVGPPVQPPLGSYSACLGAFVFLFVDPLFPSFAVGGVFVWFFGGLVWLGFCFWVGYPGF